MSFDLSAITDTLIQLVKDSWGSAPLWAELEAGSPPGPPTPTFTPNISGLAPDVLKTEAGAQLSLFLYHVETNNAVESMFWAPQGASGTGQPVRFLPFALNLYYLMSAFSEDNYHQEQQAMSVALRIFHANPIIRNPTGSPPWELTLTMEHRSYDEMSQLWQATTAPLRMSVVYRAAVVFLDPDTMPSGAARNTSINVIVEQSSGGPSLATELFGTFRRASYQSPSGPVSFTQAPATVAAGQQVWLVGENLTGETISLISEAAVTTDISGWVVAADSTPTRVVLQVPTGAATPATGRYQVQIGDTTAPLGVAAAVDAVGGPVLPHSASVGINGAGFVAGATEIVVGANTVPANQIVVGAGGTSLSFPTPAGTAGTVEPLIVRVQGVESDPALWVTL